MSDGRLVYVAYRDGDEVYRSMQPNISAAAAAGVAGWAIDDDTILQCRIHGVTDLAVWVRDRAELYITAFSNYLDHLKSKQIEWSGRGGSAQRVVFLQDFLPPRRKPTKIK